MKSTRVQLPRGGGAIAQVLEKHETNLQSQKSTSKEIFQAEILFLS